MCWIGTWSADIYCWSILGTKEHKSRAFRYSKVRLSAYPPTPPRWLCRSFLHLRVARYVIQVDARWCPPFSFVFEAYAFAKSLSRHMHLLSRHTHSYASAFEAYASTFEAHTFVLEAGSWHSHHLTLPSKMNMYCSFSRHMRPLLRHTRSCCETEHMHLLRAVASPPITPYRHLPPRKCIYLVVVNYFNVL